MRKSVTPALVLAACLLYAVPVPGHPGIAVQIRDLSSRIAADPGNSELFLKRGELYRIHRDWQAARADYRKSRELNPELVLVDFCLGRMWLEAGRPGESRAALDRFLAAQPGNPEALAFRGRARHSRMSTGKRWTISPRRLPLTVERPGIHLRSCSSRGPAPR